MGDRGNVYITETGPTNSYQAAEFENGARGIYVYAHWHGSELPTMVRDALIAGEERWTDDTYLARILIDQLTKSGRDDTTGFGVSLRIGDNSYPITIVDLGAQTVAWASPGDERDPAKWVNRTPFKEFVKADVETVPYPPGLRG